MKRLPSAFTRRNGCDPIQNIFAVPFFSVSTPAFSSGLSADRSNIIAECVSSIFAPTQRQARIPSPLAPGIALV